MTSEQLNQLPDNQTLGHSLGAILCDENPRADRLIVYSRERHIYTSTFPSEVVTCGFPDGRRWRLLCKYAAGLNHNAHGHRGGISYEADVYHQVLQQLSVTVPRFFGAHKSAGGNEAWLVLEYLDQCRRVRDSSDLAHMLAAARWLGRFHRINETRLAATWPAFLKRHDTEYYSGWANRTSRLAGLLYRRLPWLELLCQRVEAVISILLEPPRSFIHGEYYPNNILFRQRTIYPTDWESAAIASGEIDLASLIESWSPKFAEGCTSAYLSTRWPNGPPADFERRLDAARMYWDFRWLGERSHWTTKKNWLRRIDRLNSVGRRLDLI